MIIYRILTINLGSTSSKLAYYENEKCLVRTTLEHSAAELAVYQNIMDQTDYR